MALQTSRNRRKCVTLRKEWQAVLAAVLFFAFASMMQAVDSRAFPAGAEELRVWFFDIGQGDATFIEMPTGEQILIDGGRDDAVLAKLGNVMPPWDRTIDAIILTHPDADHITGLVSVLERYDVAAVYETGLERNTDIARKLEIAVDAEGGSALWRRGVRQEYGAVTLEVLAPDETYDGRYLEDPNRASIVILLTYGGTTVLLTGDATADEERRFGALAGDVDVLKAGHHGSLTSTAVDFLKVVKPEYAVVSAGKDNSYGHPHPIVLERLRAIGARVFRTDLDGDILLRSTGGAPEILAAPLPF